MCGQRQRDCTGQHGETDQSPEGAGEGGEPCRLVGVNGKQGGIEDHRNGRRSEGAAVDTAISTPVPTMTQSSSQSRAGVNRGCRRKGRIHQAGKSLGKSSSESFNSQLCDELLKSGTSYGLAEAKVIIKARRCFYNPVS